MGKFLGFFDAEAKSRALVEKKYSWKIVRDLENHIFEEFCVCDVAGVKKKYRSS